MSSRPTTPILNRSHPLARGLAFCVAPGAGDLRELVDGAAGVRLTSSAQGAQRFGPTYRSTSDLTGGISWLTPSVWRIGAQQTLAIWFRAVSWQNFGKLVNVPAYASGSWRSPFVA